MATHRLDSLEQCSRHGFDVRVTCNHCGRSVVFSAFVLMSYCVQRQKPTILKWLGPKMRCTGQAGMEGCGAIGATLSPFDGPVPPPDGPPAAKGEFIPRGVDPDAWRRADGRGRKRLIRQARGSARRKEFSPKWRSKRSLGCLCLAGMAAF